MLLLLVEASTENSFFHFYHFNLVISTLVLCSTIVKYLRLAKARGVSRIPMLLLFDKAKVSRVKTMSVHLYQQHSARQASALMDFFWFAIMIKKLRQKLPILVQGQIRMTQASSLPSFLPLAYDSCSCTASPTTLLPFTVWQSVHGNSLEEVQHT